MADFRGGRLLIFRVGDLTCAVEAPAVREILPVPDATRIPGASDAVIGLVNIRGQLITMVDGRAALRREGAKPHESIILLDVGKTTVGLAVDEVLDLFVVPEDALAPRDDLPGIESEFVRAVGRQGDQSFVLLDTDALFSPIMPL
jgi:purine-binding chemotaxis protein CheW